MTRKHFEALADALSSSRPTIPNEDTLDQWDVDVNAVADVCARFNPNFDRGRFVDACVTRFSA